MIKGIISEERRYASIPYQESGNNHQIFSDIVNSYGLAGCQDQAWCATYQFALELQMCGKDLALRHWCMTDRYVGYSVFETRDAFKRKTDIPALKKHVRVQNKRTCVAEVRAHLNGEGKGRRKLVVSCD